MNTPSIIQQQGRTRLQEVVDSCGSYSAVLRSYGLATSGSGSRQVLYRLISEWKIDLSKFEENPRYPNSGSRQRLEPHEVLFNGSGRGQHVVKRVASMFLDPDTCEICGLTNEWNGGKLVMILDHKDGNNQNHALENLRFICPNCNSQLPTTGSRNMVG